MSPLKALAASQCLDLHVVQSTYRDNSESNRSQIHESCTNTYQCTELWVGYCSCGAVDNALNKSDENRHTGSGLAREY